MPIELPLDDVVQGLAYGYETYVHGASDLVAFVNQARTGGSPGVPAPIAHELQVFVPPVPGPPPAPLPGAPPAGPGNGGLGPRGKWRAASPPGATSNSSSESSGRAALITAEPSRSPSPGPRTIGSGIYAGLTS